MAAYAMKSRIRALIFFRALVVSLLLGSAFLFRIEDFYSYPRAISSLIASLYVLTIIYSLMAARVRNDALFAYTQLVLDVLAEMVLIYITGGIGSFFSFMLILTVLSSSIVLGKRAGYLIASLSTLLYGAMLALQLNQLLPFGSGAQVSEKVFFYNIFVHILSFYVTAYLGGYLSHRLAKTEQRLEEQDTQLKDLELFNMKVIESLPSGLFTTDTSGRVQIFNRAAEKISGIGSVDLIGSGIEAALPFLAFPLSEGRREGVIPDGPGNKKIIGITISAIKDTGGNVTGYIGVFQDLTQLKKLEAEIQQKEKWATIGELSSNIAHEIRNPIASMKGSIEMLRDAKIPEKHREKLMDIVLHEMDRLDNIITDFLTYSKLKQIKRQRVDLHLILDETLALLRNIGQDRGDIVIEKDFRGQLLVNVDQQKIRQVFWNLGLNAVEAMEDGGTLTVRTRGDADTVTITFEDTGSGILPADIDRIFFPFFTTKDAGTGLGLSIAYRIIEEHQGTITVSSVPGIITTVTIILQRPYGEL
ncbi:MAG: ATP-binding protein [Nitrospiraceae bacterium]|nr:ATP-binding protein [Nitrospiraceae bacterium]